MTLDHSTRWHAATSGKSWYAMSDTHVIALIEERRDGRFQLAAQGPNGLGIGLIANGPVLDVVIAETEGHLRDLGWQITEKGFVHGYREESNGQRSERE